MPSPRRNNAHSPLVSGLPIDRHALRYEFDSRKLHQEPTLLQTTFRKLSRSAPSHDEDGLP